jgi:hypothetical protein
MFQAKECSIHHDFEKTWLVLPKPTRVSTIHICGKLCDQTSLTHIAIFDRIGGPER